jgi:cyclohexa-1,5-dienecarbonyl-CoA hydratase
MIRRGVKLEYKNIHVILEDGIGEIIFDRPPLNVLNIEMMREINQALKKFNEDPNLKLVVFKGSGKAFSAGVDVSEHTKDKVKEMIDVFHEIFHWLNKAEVPTIALVNGAALGGGCEVATFCDIVIASDKAKFGQPEIKVGVLPPIAAIVFPTLMGKKKALELILTGDIISANDAHTCGLVNHVFSMDDFEAKSVEFIKKLSTLSSAVLKITKRSINQSIGVKYQDAVKNIEEIYLGELMNTIDANEGLQAFLEKRKPVWKDK